VVVEEVVEEKPHVYVLEHAVDCNWLKNGISKLSETTAS
jgi:hypothetical protein